MDFEMTQVVEDAESPDEADSQNEEHSATLEVQTSDDPPVLQTVHLKKRTTVLGRSSSCDIHLDNKVVSQQHLSIELRKDCLFIEDLDSTNKTKIGKERLVPHVRYRLNYEEVFSVGGLRAQVFRGHSHDAVGDAGSDTCSESLLPTEEEEEGSILRRDVTRDASPGSEASTVAYVSPDLNDDKQSSAACPTKASASATTVSAVDDDNSTDVDDDSSLHHSSQLGPAASVSSAKTAEGKKDGAADAENVEDKKEPDPHFSSQGEFTPPPLPDLNFTQQEKSKNEDELRNMPTQTLPSLDLPTDTENLCCTKDADVTQAFDAETQLLPAVETDTGDVEEEPGSNESMDFRCAPTQALSEMPAEDEEDKGADFRRAPPQACTDAEDEMVKTAPLGCDDANDESIVEDDPYKSFMNAPTQALPETADQSYLEEGSAEEGPSTNAGKEGDGQAKPGLQFSRRFLLRDTETEQNIEDSVLCEATQGDRRAGSDEDDDIYCAETQEVCPGPFRRHTEPPKSPPRETVEETPPGSPLTVQETPPGSPARNFVEETPPGSPDMVPESDEEGEQPSMSANLSVLNAEDDGRDGDCLQESEVIMPIANTTGRSLEQEVTVIERKGAERTNQEGCADHSVDSQAETQAARGFAKEVAPSHNEKVLEEAETQKVETQQVGDDIATAGSGVEMESPRTAVERKDADQTTPRERRDDAKEKAAEKGDKDEGKTLEMDSNRKEGYEEEVVMPPSQERGRSEVELATREVSAVADAEGAAAASGKMVEKEGANSEAEKEKIAVEEERSSEEEACGDTSKPKPVEEDGKNENGSVESTSKEARAARQTGKATKKKAMRTADPATSSEQEPKAARSSGRRNAGKNLGDILCAKKGAWLVESSQGKNELSDDPTESEGGHRKSKARREGTPDVGSTSSRETTPKILEEAHSSDAPKHDKDGAGSTHVASSPRVERLDSSESNDSPWVPAYTKYSLAESCATQDFPSFSQLLERSEKKEEERGGSTAVDADTKSEASESAKSDVASVGRGVEEGAAEGLDTVDENTGCKEESSVQKVQADQVPEEKGGDDINAEVEARGAKKAGKSAVRSRRALERDESATNSHQGSRKSGRRAASQDDKETEGQMAVLEGEGGYSEQTQGISDQPECKQGETVKAENLPLTAEHVEKRETESRKPHRGKRKVEQETPGDKKGVASKLFGATSSLADDGKGNVRRPGRRPRMPLPPTRTDDDDKNSHSKKDDLEKDLPSGNEETEQLTLHGADDDAEDIKQTPSKRLRRGRTSATKEAKKKAAKAVEGEGAALLEAHSDIEVILLSESTVKTRRSSKIVPSAKEAIRKGSNAAEDHAEDSQSSKKAAARRGTKGSQKSGSRAKEDVGNPITSRERSVSSGGSSLSGEKRVKSCRGGSPDNLQLTPSKRQKRDSSGGKRTAVGKRQSEAKNSADDETETSGSPPKRQKRGSITSDKKEWRVRTESETEQTSNVDSGFMDGLLRVPVIRVTRVNRSDAGRGWNSGTWGAREATTETKEATEKGTEDLEPITSSRATRTRNPKSRKERADDDSVDQSDHSGTARLMRSKKSAVEVGDSASQDKSSGTDRMRRSRSKKETLVVDDNLQVDVGKRSTKTWEITEAAKIDDVGTEEDESSQKTAAPRSRRKPPDVPQSDPRESNARVRKSRSGKETTDVDDDVPQSKQGLKVQNSRSRKETVEGTDRSKTTPKAPKSRGKKVEVEDTDDVTEGEPSKGGGEMVMSWTKRGAANVDDGVESSPRGSRAKMRKSRKKGRAEEDEGEAPMEESTPKARKPRSRKETEEGTMQNTPTRAGRRRTKQAEEAEEENHEATTLSRSSTRGGRRKSSGKKDTVQEKRKEEEALNASALSTGSERKASSSGSRAKKTKAKVLFTGLEDSKGQEIVESLGGVVAHTVSECTHLVTDKFRRTVKALCCVAMGVPIVSIQWLNKCKAAGSFIDHIPYLLRDKTAEKNFGFNLETTLKLAEEERLLRDWSVHVTGHVKPAPEDMKEILTCAGAKYLPKMPLRLSEKMAVVSCEEDKRAYTAAAKKAIPVMSAEFVLTGLLQYKIDMKKYAL